jgi:alpha-ribazole phosphatase
VTTTKPPSNSAETGPPPGHWHASERTASGHTLVYLVRHGETPWNVERRFQGQLNVELSPTGLGQARAVAGWLAGRPVRFSAIYTSDLRRAAATAEAIGEAIGITPELDPRLREINVGEWSGMLADEVERAYPGALVDWHERIDRYTIPGGESIPIVQQRVLEAYRSLVDRHDGEAIIIVSHGAALSALLVALHGWDLVETWHSRRTRMGNTGVTVVTFDHASSSHDLLVMNSSEHLGEVPTLETTMDPRGGPAAARKPEGSSIHDSAV